MVKSTVHGSELARPGRATYQDVLDAPAHRVAEIIDGTLHISPRPPTLQALAKPVSRPVWGARSTPVAAARVDGGSCTSPNCTSERTSWSRDVAGWRRERLPRIPETWDAVIAPDWVCETLADSTRDLDLNGKRPVYAREGIPHLWLVDPTDRALEAFELHEGQWLQIANARDDEPGNIRPFDAITFSLGNLWP